MQHLQIRGLGELGGYPGPYFRGPHRGDNMYPYNMAVGGYLAPNNITLGCYTAPQPLPIKPGGYTAIYVANGGWGSVDLPFGL